MMELTRLVHSFSPVVFCQENHLKVSSNITMYSTFSTEDVRAGESTYLVKDNVIHRTFQLITDLQTVVVHLTFEKNSYCSSNLYSS